MHLFFIHSESINWQRSASSVKRPILNLNYKGNDASAFAFTGSPIGEFSLLYSVMIG
jgi:hypothetical protein